MAERRPGGRGEGSQCSDRGQVAGLKGDGRGLGGSEGRASLERHRELGLGRWQTLGEGAAGAGTEGRVGLAIAIAITLEGRPLRSVAGEWPGEGGQRW